MPLPILEEWLASLHENELSTSFDDIATPFNAADDDAESIVQLHAVDALIAARLILIKRVFLEWFKNDKFAYNGRNLALVSHVTELVYANNFPVNPASGLLDSYAPQNEFALPIATFVVLIDGNFKHETRVLLPFDFALADSATVWIMAKDGVSVVANADKETYVHTKSTSTRPFIAYTTFRKGQERADIEIARGRVAEVSGWTSKLILELDTEDTLRVSALSQIITVAGKAPIESLSFHDQQTRAAWFTNSLIALHAQRQLAIRELQKSDGIFNTPSYEFASSEISDLIVMAADPKPPSTQLVPVDQIAIRRMCCFSQIDPSVLTTALRDRRDVGLALPPICTPTQAQLEDAMKEWSTEDIASITAQLERSDCAEAPDADCIKWARAVALSYTKQTPPLANASVGATDDPCDDRLVWIAAWRELVRAVGAETGRPHLQDVFAAFRARGKPDSPLDIIVDTIRAFPGINTEFLCGIETPDSTWRMQEQMLGFAFQRSSPDVPTTGPTNTAFLLETLRVTLDAIGPGASTQTLDDVARYANEVGGGLMGTYTTKLDVDTALPRTPPFYLFPVRVAREFLRPREVTCETRDSVSEIANGRNATRYDFCVLDPRAAAAWLTRIAVILGGFGTIQALEKKHGVFLALSKFKHPLVPTERDDHQRLADHWLPLNLDQVQSGTNMRMSYSTEADGRVFAERVYHLQLHI